MTRTVDTDLAEIADMLRDFTGLQVEYRLAPNHIAGPILYQFFFRTHLSDPGDNHACVGSTRLAVNLAHQKLYQYRPGQFMHPELAQLVDTVLSVYYDNLEDT